MILFKTPAQTSSVLIRLIISKVFLSEGIQKLLFPEIRGAGRFKKIGFPWPESLGSLIFIEILFGGLILLGIFTRLLSFPISSIMLVAIAITKSEVFTNGGLRYMRHARRIDWAMLLGSIFLLIKCEGKYSLDLQISENKDE